VKAAAWRVVFTEHAQKDARRIQSAGLRPKAEQLIAVLATDPLQHPPSYERLVGDLQRAYSRRINIRHRLVYQVIAEERTVKVIRR